MLQVLVVATVTTRGSSCARFCCKTVNASFNVPSTFTFVEPSLLYFEAVATAASTYVHTKALNKTSRPCSLSRPFVPAWSVSSDSTAPICSSNSLHRVAVWPKAKAPASTLFKTNCNPRDLKTCPEGGTFFAFRHIVDFQKPERGLQKELSVFCKPFRCNHCEIVKESGPASKEALGACEG